MKKLKFKKELAELILEGKKTSTWRLFDDKDLQTNDEVEFIVSETGKVFAHATLGEVYEKKIGVMTAEDKHGHEDYNNDEEMLIEFSKYYEKEITLETLIKIIKFNLINK